MKLLLILFALSFPISCFAGALPDSIDQLSQMEKGSPGWDDDKYLAISDRTLDLWEAAGGEDRAKFAQRLFLVHFTRSQIFAEKGKFVEAGLELQKEAKMQNAFGGRMEFSTKSPDIFFRALAEHQVRLATKSGSDPLIGLTDYLLEKNGARYLVAREELDPEINGVTIEGIAESETLIQVHCFLQRGDGVVFENTRWLIAPKGDVATALDNARREVVRDQSERYEVKALPGPVSSVSEGAKLSR